MAVDLYSALKTSTETQGIIQDFIQAAALQYQDGMRNHSGPHTTEDRGAMLSLAMGHHDAYSALMTCGAIQPSGEQGGTRMVTLSEALVQDIQTQIRKIEGVAPLIMDELIALGTQEGVSSAGDTLRVPAGTDITPELKTALDEIGAIRDSRRGDEYVIGPIHGLRVAVRDAKLAAEPEPVAAKPEPAMVTPDPTPEPQPHEMKTVMGPAAQREHHFEHGNCMALPGFDPASVAQTVASPIPTQAINMRDVLAQHGTMTNNLMCQKLKQQRKRLGNFLLPPLFKTSQPDLAIY